MCGFTGFALEDPRGVPSMELLQRMARTLEHRGPDDEGLVVRDTCALGFRRLSIMDPEGGHQPLESNDGRILVMGNGEIYNFPALRIELEADGVTFRSGSDMEVISHLYVRHGADFVRELQGMFAVCVVDLRDAERPRILLARDRVGIKPMYYGLAQGAFWWGSEPKALLASGAFPRELRAPALLQFLMTSYVGGPESAWNGIQRLEPGHRLTWSPGQVPQPERWWDLPLDGPADVASDAEVLAALDEATRARLLADVPLGAFLSGGIDSGAVADAMARASAKPPLLCSVGFAEAEFDELDRARSTAKRLGSEHHTAILDPDPTLALDTLPWFYDEPHADPSDVPTFLVSKMAREHVTVALSGDGGDEVFGGYRRYVHDLAENRVRNAVGAPGRRLAAALGRVYPKLEGAPRVFRAKSFLSNIGRDPALACWISACQADRGTVLSLLQPDLADALGDYDPFDAFADHYRRPRFDCSLYRAQYADFHSVLPEQLLTKVDRASMAVSLEVRVPFLDHRVIERFAALPAREKIRGSRGKHRLREALRSRLSPDVLDGPKKGFDIPLSAWLRGPLAVALTESLAILPEAGFRADALQALHAEHTAGHDSPARLLWSLLVLERWWRRHAVTGIVA
tara:strand:- start:39718 stop:41607 length:1890 start_codon:yes stop_codon:yes gene_type:complete